MAIRDSQRQRCKACGRPDGFNFQVPDDVWNRIVPDEYKNLVLCLLCFDRFALEAGVNYTSRISDVMFVGDGAYFGFGIKRRSWSPTRTDSFLGFPCRDTDYKARRLLAFLTTGVRPSLMSAIPTNSGKSAMYRVLFSFYRSYKSLLGN